MRIRVKFSKMAYDILAHIRFDGISKVIEEYAVKSRFERGDASYHFDRAPREVSKTLVESVETWLYQEVKERNRFTGETLYSKLRGIDSITPREATTILTFLQRMKDRIAQTEEKRTAEIIPFTRAS